MISLLTSIRLYAGILTVVLALAGVAALAGLQAGWLVPAGTGSVGGLDDGGEDDAGVAAPLAGPQTLWSRVIPVDPDLTYELSADVRAFSPDGDAMAGTSIYLGVETFDANMRPLRSGPGTYRYGGASNRVLQPVSGWVTLSGVMVGEGDERHDQFRPGTRYVRVVALLNFRTPGMRTAIRNVRFGPRISLEPDD